MAKDHRGGVVITSLSNPKVKKVVRLRERRERDRSQLFLIEGYRELLRAVDAGVEIEELFTCPEFFLGGNEEALIQRIKGKVFPCLPAVFQKISYRDRPDGLLAVAKQMKTTLEEIKLSPMPLIVVAEAIEKPGNLGTILRSSDGVKVDAVIVCDRCTDIHNPNTVRASVGTLFTQPVVEATKEETLAFLKKHRIQLLAAVPDAPHLYTMTDLRKPLAILVGTEQLGLSDFWKSQADLQVSIPMRGVADSLNVAMATTLLLYEALRQRNPL